MRILTNPGSNLSAQTVAHYDIDLTPQQIVVDGVYHDTREAFDFAQIDRWVATAKAHPYVLGTASSEFVQIFLQLAKKDPEVIAIMTSKKVIQSHSAAVAAVRALPTQSTTEGMRVDVVDSMTTDCGAALITLAAAEARKAGLSRARVVELLEVLARRSGLVVTVATLDNLIKGGRASFLRAWVANFLQMKPIISMVDGELQSTGKITRHEDPAQRVAQTVLDAVGPKRPLWLGIAHGGAADTGRRVLELLRQRVNIAYVYFRPFAPAIYLHVGPGAIGVAALPIDDLPWTLPTPPTFADASTTVSFTVPLAGH
ncbi:MAG: DegV family protein [Myxococcota bacterium]